MSVRTKNSIDLASTFLAIFFLAVAMLCGLVVVSSAANYDSGALMLSLIAGSVSFTLAMMFVAVGIVSYYLIRLARAIEEDKSEKPRRPSPVAPSQQAMPPVISSHR